MISCSWCDKPPVKGAKAPRNVMGQKYLYACDQHEHLIEKLEFEEMTVDEAYSQERKDAKAK